MSDTPANADPFELLALSPTFEIDEAALQRAWLRRSAALHPDRVADPAEAAAAMAHINDARDTLADPERRANALLARLGGPTKEQDNSLPPDFLTGMFAIREKMEEAVASSDPAERARFEQWAALRRAEFMKSVSDRFRALTVPPTNQSLRDIRCELNAWRYIERLIEQLDSASNPLEH